MPIGTVVLESDGRFHARTCFAEEGSIEAENSGSIENKWGWRADEAARAVWMYYWRRLPQAERAVRQSGAGREQAG